MVGIIGADDGISCATMVRAGCGVVALLVWRDAQKSDAGRRVGSRLIFYPAVGSDGLLNAQSLWCIRIGQPLIRHRDRPCVE